MKNRKFIVTGYALIPVKISIETSAPTGSLAGEAAQHIFDWNEDMRKGFIVTGSEDHAAVHDFRWSEVEEIAP